MPRHATWLLSLALVAGCAAEPAAAPAPSRGADPRPRMEQIKADCMKQKGFAYIAFVQPSQPKPDRTTYEGMRAYRQKYGFGVFAMHVYPKDPLAGGAEADIPENPNDKIMMKLNSTQLASYKKTRETCLRRAAKEVLNKDVTTMDNAVDQLNAASARLEAREIDGDPELVTLAAGFADCLTAKGYKVSSTKPEALAKRGPDAFWAESNTMGDKQFPKGKEGYHYVPMLTPAEARPYLEREVKAALEDLECGKEFYARYAPRKAAVEARVMDEYGPLVGM
ncbi:hypothetical protein [Nonomuraea africana]|uniref:Lipoprotein n=1 Tax=Nonomuraea africana TaxID=46171 RepID=A0ABR9KN46_9ACTN|nr:hypothetical protein [Nonomuraea africana]MBE1563444.1 hypothetical protein [Nonomuraea africana]